MSIHLNGTKIPGFNQKLTANLSLKSVDMSGKTSYTPRAETGDKPKSIGIATQIKFSDDNQLKQIITLAEAKNGSDEREIYNIINNTANAMGIRQVRFDGDIQVREEASLQLWNISFELLEYNSVAEKKEQRSSGSGVTEQQASGTPSGIGKTDFEKVLSTINATLQ